MRAILLSAATLAILTLSACTFAAPDPVVTETSSPTATATAPAADRPPLSGEFVSQGASTEGTVTVAQSSPTEFTITLSGFSTGEGDDLRLWLNPGALVKGDDGYYSAEGNTQFELPGTVSPTDPEQAAGLEGVESVSGDTGSTVISTRRPAPVLQALAGMDALAGLQVRGATLEDVFLQLTGREYRA